MKENHFSQGIFSHPCLVLLLLSAHVRQFRITGLVIAIVTGWLIGKLNLRHWVQDWVYQTQFRNADNEDKKISFADRMQYGYNAVKEIVGKVWIYVIIGIAVGAGAHGYVPQDFMQ